MESRRDIFQALANPTRRAIIMLLTVGAMTPNALSEHFDTSRQAISKHLQILAECEIVTQEQKGREIHYHLNAKKMEDVEKWLEQFKQMIAKKLNQLDNVLEKLKHSKK
jgi:DNA-binding transcriptional ArsR family regulator